MNSIFGIVAAVAALLWLARLLVRALRSRDDDDERAEEPSFALEARGGDLIEAVQDPRVAGAGILAALARIEGEMSEASWRRIRIECRTAFRVDQRISDDIAAGGRWLSEQFEDQDMLARALSAKLQELAPREAHEDLVRMATLVANADGEPPSLAQTMVLDQMRRDLDLV